MNLTCVIQDEKGLGGKTVDVRQGEIKTLQVFFLKANGAPYPFLGTITEIVVKISRGAGFAALQKLLSTTTVSKITSTELAGAIGISFGLTAADTAGLPVSSTTGMSVSVSTSSTTDEVDFPSAINVQAALVP